MDTCDAERQEFKDKELEKERVEGGMGRAGLGLICVEFSFFCAFEMKKQSIYQSTTNAIPWFFLCCNTILNLISYVDLITKVTKHLGWFHLLKHNIPFCSSNGHTQHENVLLSVT